MKTMEIWTEDSLSAKKSMWEKNKNNNIVTDSQAVSLINALTNKWGSSRKVNVFQITKL